ncbi:hypothetical protein BW723_15980 [Polaribacter reichenbachii]|uniref:HEPN domain-containing protein n=1 Tax=Polaribacter reichenbachii TaxID=996801 RepID=A0A1B8U311_9FLAO|nr:hypothetical protein [Polaribacter reichenbachii]APZ47699.1 hypothetical protein BW723_15980 [Polaribacter reichenbachii]AUC18338.1 hypothetical protein BTO17_06420 [Polaribacter reichenbachii]OBY66232.1 hypothetical protein LPB301_06955 [Polaribacter reichenbachii]
MNSENLKNSIRIFEHASNELEKISVNGLRELSKLRKPNNVIHLKHIKKSDDLGINTLLATQRIPAIVLLGLSIELTFKLIIKQKLNKEFKIHELNKLFKKLPSEIKDSIVLKVTSDLKISESEFYNKLNENDLIFVNWRYFFEKEAPNYAGIEFLKSLHKYLKDLIE